VFDTLWFRILNIVSGHNESAIRALAKQIVRIRTQKESMMKSKATLTTVGLQTAV